MIRCVVVDDEALARELLEDNIRRVPFLELAATCKNAFEAMEVLSAAPVDLVFLDIHMPDLSGIQFLKTLTERPMVIFTTAYEQYALQGYDLDVVDYLLKPFSYERFLKSVNKANDLMKRTSKPSPETAEDTATRENFLFVRSEYKLVKIEIRDILYIEGLKDYIRIHSPEKTVVTLMSMKAIEERLGNMCFVRVHRSYIVNLRKIDYIQGNTLKVGAKDVPIGENFRENFFSIINQNPNCK
jgi:DNA-binding LytR/AlgR family response regulator